MKQTPNITTGPSWDSPCGNKGPWEFKAECPECNKELEPFTDCSCGQEIDWNELEDNR